MIPGSQVTNAFWVSLVSNLILYAAQIIEFFAGLLFPKCGCDQVNVKYHHSSHLSLVLEISQRAEKAR